jgi:hypothetical protein
MKYLLLLCAIEFVSLEPLPAPLMQLYADVYGCNPATAQPAKVPLRQINRYFPARPAVWPVLDRHADPDQVRQWRRRGVRPGVLLPVSEGIRTGAAGIGTLRDLQAAGAIPIATLDRATPRALRAERYSWCLHGLCPPAWFLAEGLSGDLSLLPPGFYLSAPHWHGVSGLPLPNRQLTIWARTVLPLHPALPDGGGAAAVIGPPLETPAYSPTLAAQWRWLGQDFTRDQTGLDTSWIGYALLGVGRLAFGFWELVEPVRLNLPALAAAGLGWLSVGLSGFNLLAVLLLVLLRMGARLRRRRPA